MSAIKIPARLLHRAPGSGEQAAVETDPIARRRRRVKLVILLCWAIILVKCFGVVWVVHRYGLPFNPMWVIGPTVAFAALATAVYFLWSD